MSYKSDSCDALTAMEQHKLCFNENKNRYLCEICEGTIFDNDGFYENGNVLCLECACEYLQKVLSPCESLNWYQIMWYKLILEDLDYEFYVKEYFGKIE